MDFEKGFIKNSCKNIFHFCFLDFIKEFKEKGLGKVFYKGASPPGRPEGPPY
jgi:hypothetical protein